MFEVGDRVIINPIHKKINWYNDRTYIVMLFDKKNSTITLDKHIWGYGNMMFSDHFLIDETYYRRNKILKLKERICLKSVIG